LEDKELTRARNAAYRLLTYRPRSLAELEAKLRDKEFGDAVIQRVIEGLIRLGYLNDRKFAEQWAASRSRLRSFGRRRIELELRNKGVDRAVITEALAGVFLNDLELETAKQAAQKKLTSMKAADRETRRRRLAGFLGRKGYSFEIIRIVLKDMFCDTQP
jgi:regulatory protein